MTMRLRLERMVHGGRVLARLEGGRVALVRGGVPGEVVEVELVTRKGVLQGRVLRVLEPSPARIPVSPHPGLDYSFIRYEQQLAFKHEVVRDALARSLGREVEVPAVMAAPGVWRYRHAIQPAVVSAGLGYRAAGSQQVVNLETDPVAHSSLGLVWSLWTERGRAAGIHELALRCNNAGEVLACLIASRPPRELLPLAHELVRAGLLGVSYARHDPRGRFRGGVERLAGKRSMMQRYGRFGIGVSATSFAQPNPAAASLLYAELESWAGSGGIALDLYAGSGVIALHLAAHYERVLAVELDRGGVARGQRDAERLGVENLEFIRADVRRVEALPEAELITVDPPRAGLAKSVREAIIASAAERLLYVSCDVATWARDVAHLLEAGFRLEKMQPYDFYPQTHHIEMLSLLTR